MVAKSKPPGESNSYGGDMVAFVDPKTTQIIECNDNFVKTVGFPKSSLIGRSVFSLYPKQYQNSAIKIFKTFLKNCTVPDTDLKLKKRGRGSIPVTLRLSASQDNHGKTKCARFSWRNISQRKEFQDKLLDEKHTLKRRLKTRTQDLQKTQQNFRKEFKKRKSAETKVYYALLLLQRQHRKLRRLAGQLLSIQEEERRRISRELHDDTCQKLAMLAFQAETLAQRFPTSWDDASRQLRVFHQQITEVAGDVRKLAHQLHPSILEHLGLVQALKAYIEECAKLHQLKILFNHRNIPGDLPGDIALCLYRVTQESLGNIMKHAQAREAWITLTGFTKSIRLSIRDNGKGISRQKLKAFQQGLGFVSMFERIRLVRGKLHVHSKVRGGTQIVVKIPRPSIPS